MKTALSSQRASSSGPIVEGTPRRDSMSRREQLSLKKATLACTEVKPSSSLGKLRRAHVSVHCPDSKRDYSHITLAGQNIKTPAPIGFDEQLVRRKRQRMVIRIPTLKIEKLFSCVEEEDLLCGP